MSRTRGFDEDWLASYKKRTGCSEVGDRPSGVRDSESQPEVTLGSESGMGRLLANPYGPCRVRFVRISRRKLDEDNLVASCKALRDAVVTALGHASDAEAAGWVFEYGQEIGEAGMRVEVY